MYKKCYSYQINKNKHKIHLWDDKDGYSETIWNDKMKFNGMYPYQKFLIEKYGNNNKTSKNHQVLFFDIECEMIQDWNNLSSDKNGEITSICYYHKNLDKWGGLLVDKENKIKSQIIGNKEILVLKNEKSLLLKFIELINEIEVDILIGWNSDKFDIPYIVNRIEKNFDGEIVKYLSPIRKIIDRRQFENQSDWTRNNPIQIYGIESLDYLRIHKSIYLREEISYKLDDIGEKYCNLKKIKYKGNLDDLYKNDIKKYIEYNFRDVEILVELEKIKNYIPLVLSICHIGKVNYGNYYSKTRINDGCITSEMIKRNGLKSIPNINLSLPIERVIGGYLFCPKSGIYNYMFDLDFKSLYPSIMMTLNIGIETYIFRIVTSSLDYYHQFDDKVNMFLGLNDLKKKNPNDKVTIQYLSGKKTETNFKKLIKVIEENNFTVSSNGICYSTNKQSSLSIVLSDWINKRDYYKNKMLECFKNGDIENGKLYNTKQKTFKILMNSVYGCNMLKSFRWGNSIIGNSITMTGRRLITESGRYINGCINDIIK